MKVCINISYIVFLEFQREALSSPSAEVQQGLKRSNKAIIKYNLKELR